MLRRADRLLVRVDSIARAIGHWTNLVGNPPVESTPTAARFRLPDDGFEIVLHSDANLPDQMFFLRVDDLMALHARRDELRIDFRSAPTRFGSGLHALVRDPFGQTFWLCDATPESAPLTPGDAGLFGTIDRRPEIDAERLAALYESVGRTADDLPYTSQFEAIYEPYIAGLAPPAPTRGEVWRHLLTLRKSARLAKLGPARSKPPEVDDADRNRLRDLLGADIGKRDRLPYSGRFDQLCDAFNQGRRRRFSPHQIWRLVATLAK